jgi:hypothetical protein
MNVVILSDRHKYLHCHKYSHTLETQAWRRHGFGRGLTKGDERQLRRKEVLSVFGHTDDSGAAVCTQKQAHFACG